MTSWVRTVWCDKSLASSIKIFQHYIGSTQKAMYFVKCSAAKEFSGVPIMRAEREHICTNNQSHSVQFRQQSFCILRTALVGIINYERFHLPHCSKILVNGVWFSYGWNRMLGDTTLRNRNDRRCVCSMKTEQITLYTYTERKKKRKKTPSEGLQYTYYIHKGSLGTTRERMHDDGQVTYNTQTVQIRAI